MRHLMMLLVLITVSNTYAKTVYFKKGRTQSINVKYVYSHHSRGSRATLLRFPTQVYAIDGADSFKFTPIKSGSFADLKMQPRFREIDTTIDVTLIDGTEIPIKVVVSEEFGKDPASYYEFKPFIRYKNKDKYEFDSITELDLMRHVLSKRRNKNFRTKKLSKKVKCKSRSVTFKFKKSTSVGSMVAYEIDVFNKSKDSYIIRPENLLIKNRDPKKSYIIHTKHPQIPTKGSNKIFVVTESKRKMSDLMFCGQKNMFIETKSLAASRNTRKKGPKTQYFAKGKKRGKKIR